MAGRLELHVPPIYGHDRDDGMSVAWMPYGPVFVLGQILQRNMLQSLIKLFVKSCLETFKYVRIRIYPYSCMKLTDNNFMLVQVLHMMSRMLIF